MDTFGNNGENPIVPIERRMLEQIMGDDQDRELSQEEKVFPDNSAALVARGDKIYQQLLHIFQGDHQSDHQEAGQEEEQPWAGNAIWDEEQPWLEQEFFRNISAPSELVVGSTSAPKTIEIKVELRGLKSKDKLYQEEEQPWLQDESFRNNYAVAVAQRGLLMGQSDHQGMDSNNSAMLALSSSVAQPLPSTTQTVPPENFELGSSSVAQPHPSATLTVPPGNFELGSSSVAQPPPSATQTVRPGNFKLGSSSVAHPPHPPPSATQRVRPGNFELGSSSVAHPPPSATQTVHPENFELGSSSVAHPPSSATQRVCPWNFEMGSSIVAQPHPSSTQTVRPENYELGSSSVARAPPSATQTVRPGNFELGSSSVAQPPPSTTQTVCPVNMELGSSNIAQPSSSEIPIQVFVGGGQACQQHRYTVHVEPDDEVVVLRKKLKLKKPKVAYLPQHYLFAFKREVMNEDRSFRDHGIVSKRGTKIEVMDFTIHFPPHHNLREAGIASNRPLVVRR